MFPPQMLSFSNKANAARCVLFLEASSLRCKHVRHEMPCTRLLSLIIRKMLSLQPFRFSEFTAGPLNAADRNGILLVCTG